MSKCKMAAIQDLGQDGNIAFPISYTISFPKMYSFHTLCYLQAEILRKPVSWWPFVNKCKMAAVLDSVLMKTLFVLISYIISFPNMYSFHTFQKYIAEILTKTCFMVAICKQMQDGGRIGLGANENIVCSDFLYYKLSKYV